MWRILLLSYCFLFTTITTAEQLEAIQIYSQDQLLTLIRQNQHLQQIKADKCQLIQDIEARAVVLKVPAYQFLFGDMLAYGVCIPKNIKRGLHYMKLAAEQGLSDGLEQLGRYYHMGKFVQANPQQALFYLRRAAALGHLKAQIRYVEILLTGKGSPRYFAEAYRWLFHAVTDDQKTHRHINQLLTQLEVLLPEATIQQAKG